MVSDHEMFYNHWESDNLFKVPLFQNDDGYGEQQRTLKSIDISKAIGDDSTEAVLDVLIGTEDGHILHGAVETKGTRAGNFTVVSQFRSVMETQYEPVLDIKIAKINDFVLVLAASETMLYQFAGKELEPMFQTYA